MDYIEMTQVKEYFAFISYQRKDEEWADRLRKKLEDYRLPSSLRKQDSSLPKEIRPIFRDALELSGGFLAKEIETALQQSKFLIVICSPNSAKSPWVNKEIRTFIDFGREGRIIPFIIDGTPFSDNEETECFPPALRSLKGEKELLGININELSRDAAAIKVVARMFGLKFDTLWQRYEREKRRKRWMTIGVALLVSLVSVGIGTYIAYQNRELDARNKEVAAERDRANSERDRAESANASLLLANDSINRQYTLIQQQRNNLLYQNVIIKSKDRSMQENQSRAVAEKIRKLIEEGDLQTAQLLALEILPSQNNTFSRPYIPEAEIALRESLAPFEKEGFKQVSTLKGNENIPPDNLIMSELEDVVYFMGRGSVYKHDLQSGEEYQFDNKGIINRLGVVGLLYDNPIYLNKEETRLCYVDWTDYIVWDTRSGKIVKKGKIDNTLVNDGNDSLILSSIDRAFVYKDGNAINNNKIEDLPEEIYKRVNDSWATSYFLSKSGNYILVDGKIFSNITDRDLFIKTRTISMNSTKMAFSKDNKHLAIGNRNGHISIVDVNSLKTTAVFRDASDLPVRFLDFSKDGRTLLQIVGNSLCSVISLYDIGGKKLSCFFKKPNIQSIAVNWDESLIATLDSLHDDGVFNWSIWNIRNKKFRTPQRYTIDDIGMVDEPPSPVWESANSLLFLSQGGHMINRWNLLTHTIKTTCATPLYTIGNGQDYISEFHLVNDKIILTACQGDHQVMDKKRLSLLYPIRHRLLDDDRESSHIQLYVAVSQVSQDGQRLLTLSNGGVLRIYDIENAQLIQQIKLPCPEGIVPIIEDCTISYDGTMIAYSYGNGIVYITTLNTIQYLIEKAKKSLNGRILNNEERRKYFLE